MSAITGILESRLPHLTEGRPLYWAALCAACEQAPPPYGEAWYGDLFRHHARDLDWLVRIIELNAKKEADCARQLWEFSTRIEDGSIRKRVKSHAIDEARHASFYVSLLQLMFPEDISDEYAQSLRTYVPKFDRNDDTINPERIASKQAILDEIVQMNIGEIRTLVNQMLMRPMVDVLTPETNRERALKLIDGLGDDEVSHIAYTADIIDEMDECDWTHRIMKARLDEFNGITRSELNGVGGTAPVFE